MTGGDVKALRETLGWSQQQLADHLGLRHRSQVTHLESGRTSVTGAKLRLLEDLRKKVEKKGNRC